MVIRMVLAWRHSVFGLGEHPKRIRPAAAAQARRARVIGKECSMRRGRSHAGCSQPWNIDFRRRIPGDHGSRMNRIGWTMAAAALASVIAAFPQNAGKLLWRQDSFAEFRKGTLEDGGAN